MSAILDRATEILNSSRAGVLSAVTQAAFEKRDFAVLRLRSNLVAVTVDSQQLIFAGLSGPSTSRVAVTLCQDESWLRRTLEVRDIPIPRTVKLPSRSANAARRYVQEIGEPASGKWQGDPETERILTADSFDTEWKALIKDQPEEEPGQVILQPSHIGEPYQATVVFDSVIDSSEELPERVRDLAVQTVAALPGACGADVTVSQRPDESFVVSYADVLFSRWDVQPFPTGIDELANKVIEGELELIQSRTAR